MLIVLIATFFYGIVILLHLYFALLEMVLWKKRAPKVFRIPQEFADRSAAMASNQGLYNLFLVVALLAPFLIKDYNVALAFAAYGLSCVIVAGIWGAITVNRRIFFIQSVPAIIAFVLYWLSLQSE